MSLRRSSHILLLLAGLALPAAVTAATSPTIDFPPTPQATTVSGRAIFTVIASGDGPLGYQWRKDGVNVVSSPSITGATSDALILTDVRYDDSGDYDVVVSNPSGSVTTVHAPLTVNLPSGGEVDSSFDPDSRIEARVVVTALQPDGRLLIGGEFKTVSGAARGGIARLNADGSTDHTFGNGLAGANGQVNSIALQPDGRVLVGGEFTAVNGVSRNRIARLNRDGSLDTTFGNGLLLADDVVYSLAVQPDGRVLVGGGFSSINGVAHYRIARLNADGSLDATFLPVVNSTVLVIAVQSDGRVVLGGDFTNIDGEIRNRIARLNPDGSLDTTFGNGLAGAGSTVTSLVVQPDGRVLVGGSFTSINGVGRGRIARLNADGSTDAAFGDGLAGANGRVDSIALQPDGRVLIGGSFNQVNGWVRHHVARLNADGSGDSTFGHALYVNQDISSLTLQPDGRLIIGGWFTEVWEVSRSRIARLHADSSLDTTFSNGPSTPVQESVSVDAIGLDTDGRVAVAGSYRTLTGVLEGRVARMNADGSTDTTFGNGFVRANYPAYSVAVQPDRKVVPGGEFWEIVGQIRNRIARLHTNGSLDTGFSSTSGGPNAAVRAIALQPDGKLLVGGAFNHVSGVPRGRIARLYANGSHDTTFGNPNTGTNGTVYAIALQPDGKVLVGGAFSFVNSAPRNRIVRLNADSSLDTGFGDGLAGANGTVRSIAVQPDARVLIGGSFTTINGVSRNRIARLNADGSLDTTFGDSLAGANQSVSSIAVQPDGRVLVGGSFTTINGVSRNRIARLNADGSLDTNFGDGLAGADDTVNSIVLQPDGRVLIAGDFATVNGINRYAVARLVGDAPSPIAPTIVAHPALVVSYDGCCATFRVAAGGLPLAYQWRKNGVDLVDGANVSGSTGKTLRLSNLSASDEGAYSVVVSNSLGSVTSDAAGLTVSAVLPQCRVATCDPHAGCILSNASGTTCDDANACTSDDTCQDGTCMGSCSCITAPDGDGDGFGDAGQAQANCDPTIPPGHVANVDDCDDTTNAVHPGAAEICDDLRNDCAASDWPSLVDVDRDIVEDACDNCLTTSNPAQANRDYDALGNACDNCRFFANAAQMNSDSDVHGDDCDNCYLDANDPQVDSDGDGIGDACEIDADDDGVTDDVDYCPTTADPLQPDADGDLVGNACDNCPAHANASQADTDLDGVGDACDACTDSDGDGLGDPGFAGCGVDPCPYDALDDMDGDGTCAGADNCPDVANAGQEDADVDGIGDACDNCPADSNPGQGNVDVAGEAPGPLVGDACDADIDGDGTANELDEDRDGDGIPEDDGDAETDPCPDTVRAQCDDNCPTTANPGQRDRDGDGHGDLCDFDDGEVTDVRIARNGATAILSWDPEEGARLYNVYRGLASDISFVAYGRCYRLDLAGTRTAIVEDPLPGEVYTYLVTMVFTGGEATLGRDGDGVERVNAEPCR